jgi:UDP-2,3-diacylglucosamine pyrophosphatase LpxH
MDYLSRVSKVFESAEEIDFDDYSKFVLMSDCHRGDGSWADSFSRNQNIYFAALTHYFNRNYTYIEIGDGDELWENRKMTDVLYEHSDVFWIMRKFYEKNRLYLIYGNHDMVKKHPEFVEKNLYRYFSERDNKYYDLFKGIKIHEGIILNYKKTGNKILLLHGHQVDFLNGSMWKISRFMVRYLWKPLENLSIKDRTRTAKNYKKKNDVAQKLTDWVVKENKMIIAGHNHRPTFPEYDDPPYFNDGCCVHTRCITGIEIAKGNITLVKWSVKPDEKGMLKVARDIVAGPCKISGYFQSN